MTPSRLQRFYALDQEVGRLHDAATKATSEPKRLALLEEALHTRAAQIALLNSDGELDK